jgi:hypothetical protein
MKTKLQKLQEKHESRIREYKYFQVAWKLIKGEPFTNGQLVMREGVMNMAAPDKEYCKQTFKTHNVGGRKYKVISVTESTIIPV